MATSLDEHETNRHKNSKCNLQNSAGDFKIITEFLNPLCLGKSEENFICYTRYADVAEHGIFYDPSHTKDIEYNKHDVIHTNKKKYKNKNKNKNQLKKKKDNYKQKQRDKKNNYTIPVDIENFLDFEPPTIKNKNIRNKIIHNKNYRKQHNNKQNFRQSGKDDKYELYHNHDYCLCCNLIKDRCKHICYMCVFTNNELVYEQKHISNDMISKNMCLKCLEYERNFYKYLNSLEEY